jgi:hypothetical protein
MMACLATSQDWKKAFFSLWKFCKKVNCKFKCKNELIFRFSNHQNPKKKLKERKQ